MRHDLYAARGKGVNRVLGQGKRAPEWHIMEASRIAQEAGCATVYAEVAWLRPELPTSLHELPKRTIRCA